MDVVDLTRALVALDSQNPGPCETEIAKFVAEFSRDRGYLTRVLEPVPGRPNVVISIDGGGPGHLAFSGHLDTKPLGEAAASWSTNPFELTIIDDIAYGLGATDMKGAVAAMLLAMDRLASSTASLGQLSLVLTADEEQGSDAGARALVATGALQGVDAIVIGEPSGIDQPWEAIHLVSRGICCFDVEIFTRQGHSGLSENLGRNAIQVASDVLRAFEGFEPGVAQPGETPCRPTVNPGIHVSGGVSFGTWPGYCRLGVEIRLVPGMDRDDVDAQIRTLLSEVVSPSDTWTLTYKDNAQGWMPAVELSPQAPLARAAAEATQDVFGRVVPFGAFPGGTDATYFLGDGGVPTITSLGPGWISVAHGADERVGVSQLHEAVELYVAIAHRYFGG